jgi:hypothetical protein
MIADEVAKRRYLGAREDRVIVAMAAVKHI